MVARTAARTGALRPPVVVRVVVVGAGRCGVGRLDVVEVLIPAIFRRGVRRAVLVTALARWFPFVVFRIAGGAGACGVAGIGAANGYIYLSTAASRASGGVVSVARSKERNATARVRILLIIMRSAGTAKFPNQQGLGMRRNKAKAIAKNPRL